MKKLTKQDFQDRLNSIHPEEKLLVINYEIGRKPATVKCLTCGCLYNKNGEYFLDKRKKSICKKCFPTHPNILKDNYKLPDGYEYVEKYQGMHNKVLIRHECGFIWAITPANIKMGKGCPKCNKKISKGEKKIVNFLKKNNIEYKYQYKIKLENHNLFIDFYLPTYNLYIEYNGEQHYKPIKHFGGQSKFNTQIYLDNIKRKYLKNNLLVIPYTQFENIEKILKSSTTISKESTIQAMVLEAENLLNGE